MVDIPGLTCSFVANAGLIINDLMVHWKQFAFSSNTSKTMKTLSKLQYNWPHEGQGAYFISGQDQTYVVILTMSTQWWMTYQALNFFFNLWKVMITYEGIEPQTLCQIRLFWSLCDLCLGSLWLPGYINYTKSKMR